MINKKYQGTKKNGFKPPVLEDKRVKYVPIGCGRCIECLKEKGNGWRVRLMEEIKNPQSEEKANFVTLTFSEKGMSEVERMAGSKIANIVATKAVRLFLERWRKKYKKSVRHFLITEIGEESTQRLHLHGIMWTDRAEEIEKYWRYGNVMIGGFDKQTGKHQNYINEKSINYIIKYVMKTNESFPDYTPKILSSKGIGKGYLKRSDSENNEYRGEETNEAYRLNNGQKVSLPTYYRNKIYTEEEREKLWIVKIEQQRRYVLGQKIDVSTLKGEEEFNRAILAAREKNMRTGYGDDTKSEEQIYTRNQRNVKRNIANLNNVKKLNIDIK